MSDNFTAGGENFATKDIGTGGNELHAVKQVIVDQAGADAVGLVTADPAANSLLGRLKAIADGLLGKATAAKQDEVTAAVNRLASPSYEAIAASQAGQTLGGAGAAGDLLASLVIVPATTSPGAVSIKDGAGGAIVVFPGGANSVTTLHPFAVPIGALSAAGGWSVITGANVSVLAVGRFT
jgi:hypothetical protein